MTRSRLIVALLLLASISSLGALVPPPPDATAQIDNHQSGSPVASVVNCIRSGPNVDPTYQTYKSPRFATSCFGSAWTIGSYEGAGNPAAADAPYTDPAVVEFGDGKPDASGSEPGHTTVGSLGTNGTPDGGVGLGAVYGLAFASGTNPGDPRRGTPRLYAAAYTKRMTRYGVGGPGAIYLLDRVSGQETLYLQVAGVVPGPAGAPGSPGDGSLPTFPNGASAAAYDPFSGGVHTPQHDASALPLIGRVGLGDIELDPQERYLYGVNLYYRAVFRVDTWSSAPATTLTYLPTPPLFSQPGTCNASGASGPQDMRPFALAVTDDSLYLGLVCTGATSHQRADLAADVARFDLASSAWDSGLATSFLLADYDIQRTGAPPTYYMSSIWQIWNDAGSMVDQSLDPQPMLTGLAFDESGQMLIGLRDRYGDLSLALTRGNSLITQGDLLVAPTAGPHRWAQPTTAAEVFRDGSQIYPNGDPPEESAGAVSYVPGRHDGSFGGEVLSTFGDPYKAQSFGAIWYDAAGGGPTAREEIYDWQRSPATFAKASGLGDVELLCAWRAVGDRVWDDRNQNGLQDPGEPDLPGVRLNLRAPDGALLAQVTTGAVGGMSGNYRFYVDPFQRYTIEIDPSNYQPGGALRGMVPTARDVGADDADSDAGADGRIAVTPAGASQVDTTLDAGVTAAANVRLDKQGPASASVGSTIVYTLAYANDGPAPAAGVTLTDTLPPPLALVGASPPPSSQSGQTLTWQLGTLAPGQSGSVTVSVSVPVDAPASVTNSAGVATTSIGDDPSDNADTVTTALVRPAVSVAKAAPAVARVGDTITYTLGYRNAGTAPAAGVLLGDDLPPELTLVSTAPPAQVAGGRLEWDLGVLAAGASGSITVVARSNPTLADQTVVTNTAEIQTVTPGDDPADNRSRAATTLIRPDLSVAKDDGVVIAQPGDVLTYTLTVRNSGSAAAQGVMLTETPPDGAAVLSGGWSQQAGGAYTLSLGSVAPGGVATRTFSVRLPQPSATVAVTNTVAVADDQPGGDPTPLDNRATDVDQVASCTVGDRVWRDDDGDAAQDPGEVGLAGVWVQVLSADGRSVVATQASGADGSYLVRGLRCGTYRVQLAPETTLVGAYFGYRVTTEPIQTAAVQLGSPVDLARDFGLRPGQTTDVTLAYFRAQSTGESGTVLAWETLDERGTDRFIVLAGDSADREEAAPVGERPSLGSAGGRYSLVDGQSRGRPRYYWLVEVERGGAEHIVAWIAPVAPKRAHTVALPLLAR